MLGRSELRQCTGARVTVEPALLTLSGLARALPHHSLASLEIWGRSLGRETGGPAHPLLFTVEQIVLLFVVLRRPVLYRPARLYCAVSALLCLFVSSV